MTTAQHGQWAKGFERYLAAGKAPSSALRAAFERFKRWLLAGAPITDEIRGVMDQLLATDAEIGCAWGQRTEMAKSQDTLQRGSPRRGR
jgi:hypothetical protein